VNSESIRGPYELPFLLYSFLLKDFRLVVLPTRFFLTINCTCLEGNFKLLTLVAYICRFDT
jgi:hypothetical protein